MGREGNDKLNIGISSIIVIIAVFALMVFAVLSVKSSNSDLLLAKRTRERVQNYYEADSKAERMLVQINLVLENYYDDKSGIALKVRLQDIIGKSGKVKAQTDKKGTISYRISVDADTLLDVKIAYNMEVGTNQYYNIIRWKVRQRS